MPDPSSPSVVTSSVARPHSTADSIDLRLLEIEHKYVVDSTFHTDDLRDRFIQYYLILVGVAFTLIVGLIQNTKVDVLVFAIIALVLFVLGICLIAIFVRLRRVIWESLIATALIKEYYKKHSVHRADLENALLWDEGSVPFREIWYSASSLLVLLVAFLDSAMLGTALFLALAREPLNQGRFPDPLGSILSAAVAVAFTSVFLQWIGYFLRLDAEKRIVARSTKLTEKSRYWGIDFEP